MKPTQDPQKNQMVLSRTFNSDLSAAEVYATIVRAIETLPALNECFASDMICDRFRVSGLDQIGDIQLNITKIKKRHRIQVFFRRADRERFDTLMTTLGSQINLRSKKGEDEDGNELIDFIQRMPKFGKKECVLFANSALDCALDCTFGEIDQLIEFIFNLNELARKLSTHEPIGGNEDLHHYLHDRRNKRIVTVIHNGEKIELNNEVCLLGNKYDCHLKIHFTWLPDEKQFLVGWFTESSELFT